MTIGNWRHPPNRDGVQWLCQQIWPAIRRLLPHAELHIYGAYMSGAASQHHKPVRCYQIHPRLLLYAGYFLPQACIAGKLERWPQP